jgi:hypothetical protein
MIKCKDRFPIKSCGRVPFPKGMWHGSFSWHIKMVYVPRMAGKIFVIKIGQEIKKLSLNAISLSLASGFIHSLVSNMFPVFGVSRSLLQLII